MTTEDDFQRRLAELEARELAVAARERAGEAKGLRYNLYERITLSRRTVDIIIIACAVAIVTLVAVGVYLGKGR